MNWASPMTRLLLQHGQRAAHELLARWRHDALPQREELELGRRVPRPAMVRWPGHINPAPSPMTSCPTWIGCRRSPPGRRPDLKASLTGYHVDSPRKTTYKVHLDGYNLLPLLTGQAAESPRKEFFYFSDDGDLLGLRYDNWKLVFAQQRVQGTMEIWSEPFVKMRIPMIINLRTDPYERAAITSNTYWDDLLNHAFLLVPAQAVCRPVPRDVQGISATAESGELQHGRGAADAPERANSNSIPAKR